MVSIADVRREVTFCKKLNLPILGLFENMSGYDLLIFLFFFLSETKEKGWKWGEEVEGEKRKNRFILMCCLILPFYSYFLFFLFFSFLFFSFLFFSFLFFSFLFYSILFYSI